MSCAASLRGLINYQRIRIAKEVRKQIVTLPQYGVFDDIPFAIKRSTIILKGEAPADIKISRRERGQENRGRYERSKRDRSPAAMAK